MESVHELAAHPPERSSQDLELVQEPQAPLTVRCPCCKGLRTIARSRANAHPLCPDCRRGDVVKRSQFHNYWLERYSLEEIRELGRAIWG